MGHGPPPQESKFYIRYRTESEKSPRTTLDWPKNKGCPPLPRFLNRPLKVEGRDVHIGRATGAWAPPCLLPSASKSALSSRNGKKANSKVYRNWQKNSAQARFTSELALGRSWKAAEVPFIFFDTYKFNCFKSAVASFLGGRGSQDFPPFC